MNIAEIEAEIRKLEAGATNYSNIEKLSMLYTVMDHTKKKEIQKPVTYSYSSEPKSEFIEEAEKIPTNELLAIIDEHLSAVRIIYPKEYNSVIRKIKQKEGEY